VTFMRADTPEKLQAWCDDYLPNSLWVALRSSIRKARSRQLERRRSAPQRNVTISIKGSAQAVLEELSESTGRTYSELIEYYLEPLIMGGYVCLGQEVRTKLTGSVSNRKKRSR